MVLADFTAMDAMWICLSVFLVVVAVALAFLLIRLAGTAGRLTSLLGGLEDSAIPLINKTSESLDEVNKQLVKVDLVTDSAVDAADKADTAVRAVSLAVTAPVTKVSGLAKGVSHGASAFMAGNDFKSSMAAGREAARRREREIGEELVRVDQRAAEAAAAVPPPPESGASQQNPGAAPADSPEQQLGGRQMTGSPEARSGDLGSPAAERWGPSATDEPVDRPPSGAD